MFLTLPSVVCKYSDDQGMTPHIYEIDTQTISNATQLKW